MSKLIKISVLTGLATTGAVALYEVSNMLLIYHYFTYQYYIAGVAIIALSAGVILTGQYYKNKDGLNLGEAKLHALTGKELRVLELISRGKSNKEIAALNYIEMSTVKTHINNIYCKLGVKNRKDATAAYQKGIDAEKSTLSPPAII